jgi:hypothetical protein
MKPILLALAISASSLNGASLLVNPDFEALSLPDPGSISILYGDQGWGMISSPAGVIRDSSNPFITGPMFNNVASLLPGSGMVQKLTEDIIPETTYRVALDYRLPAYGPPTTEGQIFRFGIGVGSGTGRSTELTSEHLPSPVFEIGGVGQDYLIISTTSGVQSVAFEFTTGWFTDGSLFNPTFYVIADEANSRPIYIDNVSVSIVPEPSGWILLLAGSVVFLFMRQRNNQIKNTLP